MAAHATDDEGVPSAATVFAGLTPSSPDAQNRRPAATRAKRVATTGAFATLPVVLMGTMTLGAGVAPAPAHGTETAPADAERTTSVPAAITVSAGAGEATTPAELRPAAVPSTYSVQRGDTVSAVAGRFGLSTASVLSANGLGWNTVIFPGQLLKLNTAVSAPAAPATPRDDAHHTIRPGDTITRIAAKYGLSTATLLAANNLTWTSIIYAGQTILIPGGASGAAEGPTTPVVSTPAAPVSSRYVIRAGDTVTGIAGRFGVSVRAVLEANGLDRSGRIYVGRTLTIPAIDAAAADQGVTPLTEQMRANARLIVAVGRDLGVPDEGLVVALAAAMQESSLRNVNFGDRDSVGVFQQRPSTGWGSPEELLNVTHAARLFFGGPSNPNRGHTRGLLDIPGWQAMSVNDAAQAVQRSGHPDAYGKWEKSARAWVAELG